MRMDQSAAGGPPKKPLFRRERTGGGGVDDGSPHATRDHASASMGASASACVSPPTDLSGHFFALAAGMRFHFHFVAAGNRFFSPGPSGVVGRGECEMCLLKRT